MSQLGDLLGLAGGDAGEALAGLIERIGDLDYEWGVSDRN